MPSGIVRRPNSSTLFPLAYDFNEQGRLMYPNLSAAPSPIAHTDIPAGTFTLDVLPPFKMLASDEEREKKAQSSVPGTYHVICVPESFSDLPEYAENEPDGPKDLSSSPEPGSGSNRLTANVSEVSDPNILILRSFRDARGNPYLSPRDSPHSPNSDLRESSLSSVSAYTTVPDFTEEDRPCPLQPHEIFLLDHFRTAAWRKVIPWAGIFESPSGYEINSDVFEQEAAKFPPVSGPSPDLLETFFSGDGRPGAYHYNSFSMP